MSTRPRVVRSRCSASNRSYAARDSWWVSCIHPMLPAPCMPVGGLTGEAVIPDPGGRAAQSRPGNRHPVAHGDPFGVRLRPSTSVGGSSFLEPSLRSYKIGVVGGDGIGPEVTAEALKVARAAGA